MGQVIPSPSRAPPRLALPSPTRTPCAPPTLCRAFRDAPRTQQLLNAHTSVARATAYKLNTIDGTQLRAVVLPKLDKAANDQFCNELRTYLRENGFTGQLKSIAFVVNDIDLPDQEHERVVLNDVLRAIFKDADTNGDGEISMREMKDFLARHNLNHVSEFMNDFVHRGPVMAEMHRISFLDFKSLLLNTKLVNLSHNTADQSLPDAGQYLVHESLLSIVAGVIFDRADADNDGKLYESEIEYLFRCYGLGDAERARREFMAFDIDKNGYIDRSEFKLMLQGKGLVRAWAE